VTVSGNRAIIAAEGTAANADSWVLLYEPEGYGGRHHLAFLVNGFERGSGSGFDIPATTEIGFGGDLTPGVGHYYLYGLTSSRVREIRAQGVIGSVDTTVATEPLPGVTANDGTVLRSFVIVRPPVDDVTALVGLDEENVEIQRIRLR
jgi:hypothetical protein